MKRGMRNKDQEKQWRQEYEHDSFVLSEFSRA